MIMNDKRLENISFDDPHFSELLESFPIGILLLDEPTTFLDPRHAGDILRIMVRLNRELGVTVVSVTHDINNAALHSHRIIALREGSVTYDGLSEGIMDNRVLGRIYGGNFLFTRHPQTGSRIVVPEGF